MRTKLIKQNKIVCVVLAIVILFSVFASRYYYAELATHFMLHYTAVLFAVSVVFLLNREWLWASLATSVFLISLYLTIEPYSPYLYQPSSTYDTVSVLQFNVNYGNQNIAEVIKIVEEKKADIVVLQEITPALTEKLAHVIASYQWKLSAPEEAAFGVLILSNVELQKPPERQSLGVSWNKYSHLELLTPKNKIFFSLLEIHTFPPVSANASAQRNAELQSISSIVIGLKNEAKILLGDLNITPYSPYFKAFEKNSGLSSAMRVDPLTGTWPAFFPAIFRIPIDHLLVSPAIEVVSREVLSSAGSDHLPILTILKIYKQPHE